MYLSRGVVKDKLESRCGELLISVDVVGVGEQVVVGVVNFGARLLYLE
jgi:hypothetical protein